MIAGGPGLVEGIGGNVGSVRSALRRLGLDPRPVRTPLDAMACDRLILPGVGTFGHLMQGLRDTGLDAAIRRFAAEGRPILGICVGMQVLADQGDEGPGAPGLGLVPGRVVELKASAGIRVPHMGWSDVRPTPAADLIPGSETGAPACFYFVHSFAFEAAEPSDIAATCEHGRPFAAAVQRGSVYGVQFHPERSQREGLDVLDRFLRLAA